MNNKPFKKDAAQFREHMLNCLKLHGIDPKFGMDIAQEAAHWVQVWQTWPCLERIRQLESELKREQRKVKRQ
jgi:hypothetical protein